MSKDITQFTDGAENNIDFWLLVELNSWSANESVDWDADGSDIDPQFQICLDVHLDLDNIIEHCVWTDIWQDEPTLFTAWNYSHDIPNHFEQIDISIACWDNDDISDEWNDGDDICDLNSNDDSWKMTYQINSSEFSTENITGSGFGDNNSQEVKETLLLFGDFL